MTGFRGEMPLLPRIRRALHRPIVGIVLLLLAGGIWGVILCSRPSPISRHIEAGLEFARRGQGAQAEQEWRAAVRRDANDPRAYVYLTEYYTAVRNWPAAVEAARQVVRLQPETPHINALLARCSLNAGDE